MKHAYLILAHNEPEILKRLLSQLDWEDNDIYLHIDKKSSDIIPEEMQKVVSKGKLFLVKRIPVEWGDMSQMRAELILLRKAVKTHHDYYHLLSGVDLLIKNHNSIRHFFEINNGYEFVSFDESAMKTKNFYDRLRYFRLPIGRNPFTKRLYRHLNPRLLKFQKKHQVDRTLHYCFIPAKGSQWFDITEDFAHYLLKKVHSPKYFIAFHFTSCIDEIFIQTIIYNSPFRETLYRDDIHFIDWSNHSRSPEILTKDYFYEIKQSDCLYARKFSYHIDSEIVDRIFNLYTEK